MADLAHLEMMGRELKCPICLSLLNSAVSLVCNHVFCSSCISNSTKVASNCPVCKVPYRRREVCPAPHMDNLVSIYKSMEVAAGVALFGTQTAHLAKNPDGSILGKDEKTSGMPQSKKPCKGKSKKKPVSKRKANELEECSVGASDSHVSTMPVFPANKRVHVTPYPVSETPLRPEKIKKLGDPSIECEVNGEPEVNVHDDDNNLTTSKEASRQNENVHPVFSPFFWMRDDIDDIVDLPSSQRTADSDMFASVPPCFSDIMDSDDDFPLKTTPTSKPHQGQVFDSEIFEWTQRACSPELCSTPVKKQIVDKNREGGSRVRCERVSQTQVESETMTLTENTKSPSQNEAKKKVEICRTVKAVRKTIKKRKGSTCRVQKTNAKESLSKTNDVSLDETFPNGAAESDDIAENSSPLNADMEINDSNLGRKSSRISKIPSCNFSKNCVKKGKNQIDNNAVVEGHEQVQPQPANAKSQIKESNNKEGPSAPFYCPNRETDKGEGDKNSKISKNGRLSHRSCKGTSFDDAVTKNLEEIPTNLCRQTPKQCQENQQIETPSPASPSLQVEDCEAVEFAKMNRKKDVKAGTKLQMTKERRSDRKSKVEKSMFNMITTEHIDNHGNNSRRVTEDSIDIGKKQVKKHKVKKMSTKQSDGLEIGGDQADKPCAKISRAENTKENFAMDPLQNSGDVVLGNSGKSPNILHDAKDHWLNKCNRISPQIKCSFCLSSKETEVSGEIVHYFNGKPVASDHNKGINVVHSHRQCTEWAPDVYFEDETVVNLANELARSKRIKCSCCGIKGAALGCYEKSCRKSFHFTCAKLIPQCRWDTENFVMLCPLHSTSKLPCEVSAPEKPRKRRISPKGEPSAQTMGKRQLSAPTTTTWKWPLGSPHKWILCCSALTAAEKEIVLEFTKLTGVSVSKAWAPNVTHIIASTDENGACKRTLKVLMGIIEGKWILKIDWLRVCLRTTKPVDEEQFVIRTDNHGISDGPRRGRLRAINKEPKLFCGFKFYFIGDFTTTYKGYLHELVIAAGGTVLQRKPISKDKLLDESLQSDTYVIYSRELPENHKPILGNKIFERRLCEAKNIAGACGANVASNTWILDSIASYSLQSLEK